MLPQFKKQRSLFQAVVRHGILLALCVALGLFYGLAFTILPPQLALYLGGPILIIALLVIWALPDLKYGPTRLLAGLLFGYVGVLALWPNYLAFQLPGLPWISLRRLVAFPLTLIFLICLSVSSKFRAELSDVLESAAPLKKMVFAFTAVQLLTILLSDRPFFSLNITLNYLVTSTVIFFVAAWYFTKGDRAHLFTGMFLLAAVFLAIVGLFEFANQGVLWANHIPSFLKVDDESVSRTLTADIRDGAYRVVTIFSGPLSMAEFLALATPFAIHRIVHARSIWKVAFWFGIDFLLLTTIVLTQSRLGIVGWLVAHACYGSLWSFRRWSRLKTDIISPAISMLYPIAVSIFFFMMFTVPAVRNRTIGGGSTGLSDNARREQYAMLWPKLFKNPFGYGSGRSGDVLGFTTPGGLVTVDSYIITMLLDYGVIGFLLYASLLIYGSSKMIQVSWHARSPTSELALPLACAFISAIFIRMVLSQTDNISLQFLLLGLATAIAFHAKATGELETKPSRTA